MANVCSSEERHSKVVNDTGELRRRVRDTRNKEKGRRGWGGQWMYPVMQEPTGKAERRTLNGESKLKSAQLKWQLGPQSVGKERRG